MASKKDVLIAILKGATVFIPGGTALQTAIQDLATKDDDPTNDVEEVSHEIAQVSVQALVTLEGITNKDYINDPVFQQLVRNIEGDIALLRLVLVKHHA